MNSAVYYKFKSQRTESRIPIDGTGISVFDLKREIILANALEKSLDIDLQVFDPTGEEEYKDDQLIPRSSTVIVKRVPIIKGSKSRFGRYLAGGAPRQQQTYVMNQQKPIVTPAWARGTGAFSKRFDGRDEPKKAPQAPVAAAIVPPTDMQGDEGAAIQAMFQEEENKWVETQEHMAQQQRVFSAPRFGANQRKPIHQHVEQQRELPVGYICYRCGLGGHWIHDCPTNNDPNFDKRRIKRTTGIPRSFLEAVEKPTEGGAPLAQGVMVTPDGGYVIARPDIASWEKQKARSKGLTETEIRERIPENDPLKCPICSNLLRDALRTPCCNTLYCEDCIQSYLSDNDFICPNCNEKIATLASLKVDQDIRNQVNDYIDAAFEEYHKNEVKSVNVIVKDDDEANNQQAAANPFDGIAPDPAELQKSIQEMQAQLTQLQRMLGESNIPLQSRLNAQMQATQLTRQIAQTQEMVQVANQIISATAAAAAASEASARGYQKGEYRPGWTNPFPNQQPVSADSAYQRLPVNPRRRTQKRGAEWDPDQRDPKVARYWE